MKNNNCQLHEKFQYMVFVLFIVILLMCIAKCASGYTEILSQTEENDRIRTTLMYIIQKSSDENAKTYVYEKDGIGCLAMESTYNSNIFVTYLYVLDGYLYELTTMKDAEIPLSEGKQLVCLDTMKLENIHGRLIKISVSYKNSFDSIIIKEGKPYEKTA